LLGRNDSTTEVHILHRCIGADEQLLTGRNVDNRGVVPDSGRARSPLHDELSNEIRFFAHVVTAGSRAMTGASSAGSRSFQARGRANKTSSRETPRTYPHSSAARPCTHAAMHALDSGSQVCASNAPAMPER